MSVTVKLKNQSATQDDHATIEVYDGDELVHEIHASVTSQHGADMGLYPVVRLKSIEHIRVLERITSDLSFDERVAIEQIIIKGKSADVEGVDTERLQDLGLIRWIEYDFNPNQMLLYKETRHEDFSGTWVYVYGPISEFFAVTEKAVAS